MTSPSQSNGKPDITLHDVLVHQQVHFGQIQSRFSGLEKDIKEVKEDVRKLNQRTSHVEFDVHLINTKIDHIGERLDDIETIPPIVKELRKRWKH